MAEYQQQQMNQNYGQDKHALLDYVEAPIDDFNQYNHEGEVNLSNIKGSSSEQKPDKNTSSSGIQFQQQMNGYADQNMNALSNVSSINHKNQTNVSGHAFSNSVTMNEGAFNQPA